MKAEHRKELQTNALADRIGRFFKGMKTKTSSNGLAILLIVVVIGVLFLAWMYFSRATKRAQSAIWVSLDKVTNEELSAKSKGFHNLANPDDESKKTIERLERIAKENSGTKAALMARFQIAQFYLLNQGINMLPQIGKMDAALKNLDRAEEEYEKLAKEVKNDAAWEPQALLALAKIAKTRAVVDLKNLDKAQKLYEELADKYGNTAAGKEAAAQAKDLKDDAKRATIKEIYVEMGRGQRASRPGS